MADVDSLEALQALHRELLAVCEHRVDGLTSLEESLDALADRFKNLLDTPPKKKESRDEVISGKVGILGQEYSINKDFQELSLQLADELNLDEIQAVKLLLESEDDRDSLGRPLVECGLIRFHQQRKYLLDCMRLCISIADDEDLEEAHPQVTAGMTEIVAKNIFGAALPGQAPLPHHQRFVPRCVAAMGDLKSRLQRLAEKVTAVSVVYGSALVRPEFQETIEFTQSSLIQQHEALAVMLCSAVDKRHAEVKDFEDLVLLLKRADRYDHLLVHLFPVLGSFIRVYGSTEGVGDVPLARKLNAKISKQTDDDTWRMPSLHAAAIAWWIAEYSGLYAEDQQVEAPDGVDLDQEDRQRSKQFTDSLKAGAFDFMLAVATDVKTVDWQDPTRRGVQQWLQRKSPSLSTESVPFSDYFQARVLEHLEFFIDAFISNLPDVLRRLRVEEDEQRQLSQTHEQDLDLERFLLIISCAYGGRPEAAEAFWSEPDSNLAGFMHWASRRASTPLVSAFCEMLQSVSENETCAGAAHLFLLDEGHSSSGKLRRSLSLTWSQIFKELEFFTNKIRDRATTPQLQTYRAGKPTTEQSETEPESAMMLECYLRLISKLSSNSQEARQWLLRNSDFALVPVLFQLASLPIPSRLRACAFFALKALLNGKSQEEGFVMWSCLDTFMTGGYSQPAHATHRPAANAVLPPPSQYMESFSQELSRGFEEANAFVQFLLSLIAPLATDTETVLHDSLPFPENLGSLVRMPGIEPYVDFVLGKVFSSKPAEAHNSQQLRILRLSCLEFALTCLATFNEDLILIGNETNIAVDTAITTSNLATYVRLHPFARVMEWMFNPDVVQAIVDTIHQDSSELGSAPPDSPLILGIIRAVDVISKVLERQDTYLDLVRQVVRSQSDQRRPPVNHSVYASFEEGVMNHLDLIVDLGRCCNLGHPALTLGCLKLLEKISTSPRIVSAWNPGSGRQTHRNKAIVALEKDNAAAAIASSLVSEIVASLDLSREADAPNFLTKIYILEFLHACLQASPHQPTIAHLLLGFQCAIGSLSVAPGGAFESRSSLFHNLLRILLEAPFGDDTNGMRHWLITLKCKAMRVLQALWSSPLSSAIVLGELRDNDFLFHLVLREVTLQPELPWDGVSMDSPQFLGVDGAMALIEYLELRAMELEYFGMELCSVSQNRLPHLKRRIFDALNGRVVSDDGEPMATPTIFSLYDFLFSDEQWENPVPTFAYLKDLDLRICLQDDTTSTPMYNMDLVREILQLKRAEGSGPGAVITKEQDAAIKEEEGRLHDYLILSNRQRQLEANRLKVLTSWSNLLLVMSTSDESDGAAKAAFLLQGLQTILPNLETAGDAPEAYELAKLAKVLLFKLDLSPGEAASGEGALGDLMSEKLFQLFQVSLYAIVRWAGNPDLRAVYYGICYRYVTGIVDEGRGFLPGRQKTIKSIQLNGERLLNVICDDAYGGDVACQTAALILLGALVKLGHHEDDAQVVDTLNRLNFIGILVDSLKTVMQEGLEAIDSGSAEQRRYQDAKLALLLQLCQTRSGAGYVLHANLFRAIELSGLFTADPELQIDSTNTAALAQHYGLLVKAARIIGAALLSRGSHNVLQGRRFLTDHHSLVLHVLKRSAGIGAGAGAGAGARALDEQVAELAEAFMLLITATGFLEFEEPPTARQTRATPLFH